jgi:hypothetical protein
MDTPDIGGTQPDRALTSRIWFCAEAQIKDIIFEIAEL